MDAVFSHAGAQGAGVEPEDLRGPIFPGNLPAGFFEYPNNMVVFDLSHCFWLPIFLRESGWNRTDITIL